MTRRSGVTLIEVLVSIFVTAIGLLGLLALFPVGAFSMAQAIKNGRCVQASVNATAFAKIANIGTDTGIVKNTAMNPVSGTNLFTFNPAPTTLPSPPAPPPDLTTQLKLNGQPYDGPSYPVYVDPIGRTNLGAKFVGTAVFPGSALLPTYVSWGIPRSSLGYFSGSMNTLRCMTLLDDIRFNPDGSPTEPAALVQREDRYSWTYMLQRPVFNSSGLVNVTVVVYSGRSPYVLGESTYSSNVAAPTYPGIEWKAGTNQVDVNWDPTIGQSKPIIKNGTWILDATTVYLNQTTLVASIPPEGPHGYFYRVVGVTEIPGTNTLTLELQSNIRADSRDGPASSVAPFTSNPGAPVYRPYGVLVVMENVVEVFEKGAMAFR